MQGPLKCLQDVWQIAVGSGFEPALQTQATSVQLQTLEDRILYDASPLAALATDFSETVDLFEDPNDQLIEIGFTEVLETHFDASPVAHDMAVETMLGESDDHLVFQEARQLLVIDWRIEDIEMLVEDVINSSESGIGFDVVRLDQFSDGIAEITELLDGRQSYDAIHILSHGNEGLLQLGSSQINSDNLGEFEGLLSSWTTGLAFGADILLYGCDVASGEEGQLLVDQIAEWTGADVAASTDLTGHTDLGGDWDLEFSIGEIETEIVFSSHLQSSWMSLLVGPSSGHLLLSTDGDVGSPSGAPGLDNWTDSEVLEFGGSDLNYEPGVTTGTFSSLLNLENFTTGGANINAIHHVSVDITVGSTNSIDLFVGDLLLSIDDDETLTSTNSLSVDRNDVFVFRPDTIGDYSAGTFIMLLDNFPGHNTHGITLVEQDTVVGGTLLAKGSFLFSEHDHVGDDTEEQQIFQFSADDVGAGTTTGTITLLIDGADIGIVDGQIEGLELIENTVIVGGTTLQAGSILLTLEKDAIVGDNGIATLAQDIFYLDVTSTGVNTVADATMLFQGADVGLDIGNESLDGLSLITTSAPILDLDADDSAAAGSDFATTFTENAGPVAIADVDAVISDSVGTSLIELEVAITNLLDGVSEMLATDTTGTGVTASYDSLTGVLTLSGSDSLANYQQVLRSVTYENTSQDPNTTARIIIFVANNGSELSNTATTTVGMIAVNDAPVESTIEGAELAYTENDVPTAITGTITITDVDDTNIESATIQITGNYTLGEDVLAFANLGPITGVWNAVSGTMTLTGSDSLANYEIALRSVTYENTSENPSTAVRTITFIVDDGDNNSNAQARNITTASINDDPTSVSGVPADVTVIEETASNVDLSLIDLDDVDAGSSNLSVTLTTSASGILSAGSGGGVVVIGSGTTSITLTGNLIDLNTFINNVSNVQYTGPTGLTGNDADTIQVDVTDNGNTGTGGGGTVGLGGVNVDITNVNEAPVAVADSVTVAEGATATVAIPGVLGNDTDVDGDTLTASLVSGPTNGALILNPDGSFTYTHDGSETTSDSFQYRVDDGSLTSNVATVTITVTPVNNAPVGVGESFTFPTGLSFNELVGVLANDSDAEFDPIIAILATAPSNGTVSLNPDGSFTYVPNAEFIGNDSFTYLPFDGSLFGNVTTVSLNVIGIALPPGPTDSGPDVDPDSEDSSDDPTDPDSTDSPDDVADDTLPDLVRNIPSPSDFAKTNHDGLIELDDLDEIRDLIDLLSDRDQAEAVLKMIVSNASQAVIDDPEEIQQLRLEAGLSVVFDAKYLWDQLDDLAMPSGLFLSEFKFSVGAIMAVSTSGYILWSLRSGVLIAAALSQIPAWRMIDPLPVLESYSKSNGTIEDDEVGDFFN